MFREQTSDKASPVSTVLGLILLLVPLFLSITWGLYFRDSVFILLQAAQELTGSLGKAAPEFVSGMLTQAPLYVGLMAAAGSLAPQVGLIVCALGWSATAWLVFYALRAAGRPLAALITPVLLVFSPLVITTLGTEYSWVLALGWACMALTVFPPTRRRWAAWLKPVLLLLLLGLHFNAATILFALALLAVDIYNGRAGWLPFILVAASSFLWGFFMIPRAGGPPAVDPVLWLQNGATLMASRQLVWLYVPFILAGLWDVWVWEEAPGRDAAQGAPTEGQQFFALLILWAAAAVLARSPAAPIIAAVTAAALAGLGAAWLVRRVLAPGRLEIDPRRTAVFVPVLITMPLLLAGLLTLWDLYHTRPVQQADLQDQAAAWLAANADAGATLFAPPRAGYLAGRATIPALVERISDGNVDAVYGQLLSHTPQFIVSEGSFAWDYITRTTWFQERYQPRAQFENAYASASPVTVWEYVPSPFDAGEREEIAAVIDERFTLVGYQFEPRVISPGDDVFLTLYLQALEPVDHGFITGVHLSAPDGWVWAWREERTPRALSGQWWAPGQVIPERIRLQTTEDIPLGAYDLQVFWRAADDKSNWPIIRQGDENILDRLFLGYVVAPPAVDTEGAMPVQAQFGERILLDAYEVPLQVTPGQPLDVTLYWEALSPPAADYTVFVHLLDEQGQIVAAHDSMPAGNRFPTRAWQPGLQVMDAHPIDLPADLAPGTYQVSVGLYLLETGERLPVRDAGGVDQPDRSLPLTTVTVNGVQ